MNKKEGLLIFAIILPVLILVLTPTAPAYSQTPATSTPTPCMGMDCGTPVPICTAAPQQTATWIFTPMGGDRTATPTPTVVVPPGACDGGMNIGTFSQGQTFTFERPAGVSQSQNDGYMVWGCVFPNTTCQMRDSFKTLTCNKTYPSTCHGHPDVKTRDFAFLANYGDTITIVQNTITIFWGAAGECDDEDPTPTPSPTPMGDGWFLYSIPDSDAFSGGPSTGTWSRPLNEPSCPNNALSYGVYGHFTWSSSTSTGIRSYFSSGGFADVGASWSSQNASKTHFYGGNVTGNGSTVPPATNLTNWTTIARDILHMNPDLVTYAAWQRIDHFNWTTKNWGNTFDTMVNEVRLVCYGMQPTPTPTPTVEPSVTPVLPTPTPNCVPGDDGGTVIDPPHPTGHDCYVLVPEFSFGIPSFTIPLTSITFPGFQLDLQQIELCVTWVTFSIILLDFDWTNVLAALCALIGISQIISVFRD